MSKKQLVIPRSSVGFDRLKALARKHGNFCLTLAPPHKNIYRDFSPTTVQRMESKVRENLKAGIIQSKIPVFLSADKTIRDRISVTHLLTESRRGDVWRFTIQDVAWFDQNWHIFSGPFEFGSRRQIHLFLQFDAESLATLVSNWYDPNVLTNPSIASSPRAISEIRKQLTPGTLVFSIALFRLSESQLYFHPSDIDFALKIICGAAQKTKWWWKMLSPRQPERFVKKGGQH